jgi:hypothetical protein
MKPSMDEVLIGMAGAVGLKIIPDMPETSYALGDAKMVTGLAVLLAQEVDQAADVLIRENAAFRGLFRQAAKRAVGVLKPKLAEAAATSDANFRVSTLEAGNAELKALLIELHALVEKVDAQWARAINAEIWAVLKQGADDRMLVLPSM